jgi:hypothetical protein
VRRHRRPAPFVESLNLGAGAIVDALRDLLALPRSTTSACASRACLIPQAVSAEDSLAHGGEFNGISAYAGIPQALTVTSPPLVRPDQQRRERRATSDSTLLAVAAAAISQADPGGWAVRLGPGAWRTGQRHPQRETRPAHAP